MIVATGLNPLQSGEGSAPSTGGMDGGFKTLSQSPSERGGERSGKKVTFDGLMGATSCLNPLQSGEGSAPLPLVSPISSIICKGKSDTSADPLPGAQFSRRNTSKKLGKPLIQRHLHKSDTSSALDSPPVTHLFSTSNFVQKCLQGKTRGKPLSTASPSVAPGQPRRCCRGPHNARSRGSGAQNT